MQFLHKNDFTICMQYVTLIMTIYN